MFIIALIVKANVYNHVIPAATSCNACTFFCFYSTYNHVATLYIPYIDPAERQCLAEPNDFRPTTGLG